MCQFAYYKSEETYYPQLYCHLKDNEANGYCQYRKKCEDKQKFIIISEIWKDCYLMNDFIKKEEIPEGSFRVVSFYEKNGKIKLFVDVNGNNIVIQSPNNKPLEYVYLKKDGDNYLAFIEKPQEEKKIETVKIEEEPKKKKKNGKNKN